MISIIILIVIVFSSLFPSFIQKKLKESVASADNRPVFIPEVDTFFKSEKKKKHKKTKVVQAAKECSDKQVKEEKVKAIDKVKVETKEKEEVDEITPERLIIYSAIMTPKFKEL